MKLDALDHPKTLDFAARLNVTRPTAIGHLELFWHFVSKHAPQGNVGKFPDGSIARACEWQGDPLEFLKSLLMSGFLDVSAEHRYLVHDWPEHCPNWVRAQLQKLKRPFFLTEVRTEEPTEERTEERTAEPSSRAHVLPSQGKGSEGKACVSDAHASRIPMPGPGEGLYRDTNGVHVMRENRGDAPLSRAHALGDVELMDAFAVVRLSYPPFSGRQDWLKAEHNWRHRIELGATVQQLSEGVERYAKFVAAGGVSGPAYVLTPAKFFGDVDQPWAQAWTPPPTKAEHRLAGNLSAAEEFMRRTEAS